MSVIDVDALLADLSEESPCGDDLEYDPEFVAMEAAAKSKPEQEMGAPGEPGHKITPAEPPNWRELKKTSLSILKRSRDLRAVTLLSRALVATDGFSGLHDGLALLTGLCEARWPEVHPLLDPDEDNDPLMRVNVIEGIAADETLREVEAAPLVAHNVLGRFGLREMAYASGQVPLPEDYKGDPPTTAMIEGAFMECELDELTATADAVNGSIELLDKLDGVLAGVMEISMTPDLSALRQQLVAAQAALKDPLERRGIAAAGDDAAGASGGEAGQQAVGEISTREDVVRAIDRICEFYRRHEPSSPVPLLLQRAKRLVPKDFMEIVQDLAPSGVSEVRVVAGSDDDK